MILRIKEQSIVRWILSLVTVLTISILVGGYTLSAIGFLDSKDAWSVYSSLVFIAGAGNFWHWNLMQDRNRNRFLNRIKHAVDTTKYEFLALPRLRKFVIAALGGSLLITASINLSTCLLLPPHNWDSMTYHLARVAYYLQHNSLAYYDASYWAQVIHPKNSAVLLLFSWLSSNGNENLLQMNQYVSYFIALLAVYGLSRELGGNRMNSITVSLVFGLLTEVLMEASTTQNDLLIATCFAVSIYFILGYGRVRLNRYFIYSALSFSIALGMKGSALLLLPSMLILLVFSLKTRRESIWKIRIGVVGKTVIWCSIVIFFVLPSGYVENQMRYGNPLAPEEVVSKHAATEKAPWVFGGVVNMARYSIDFISLDGFLPVAFVRQSQQALKAVPVQLYKLFDVDIGKESFYARSSFLPYRSPVAHEDGSYWGIMGFGFIWLAVLLAIVRFRKNPEIAVFAFSSCVFFMTQAFVGPYDPWRGRYFISFMRCDCPSCNPAFFEISLEVRQSLHSDTAPCWLFVCNLFSRFSFQATYYHAFKTGIEHLAHSFIPSNEARSR